MPNQHDLSQMAHWVDVDLAPSVPNTETQEYEFKCSLISDSDLTTKIQKAASGFWNSGGGYLILGVDGNGKPDGGIPTSVGRQSRKDWIDRVIRSVAPPFPGGYTINEIVDGGNGLSIKNGYAVYVIGFANSELAPHMADGRYYVRAGAHTEPAPSFIVEALFARRGKRQPQLRLELRANPLLPHVVELSVVNVGLTPAIDVVVEFTISPPGARIDSRTNKPTARKNLIDREHPLNIAYVHNLQSTTPDEERLRREVNHITLRYKDQFLNEYKEDLDFRMSNAVEVSSLDGTVLDRIALSLRNISVGVAQLAEGK